MISTPLLRTKLYVPAPRPAYVPRQRLITALNLGLQKKLSLISAPAGFGKSTLLSAWAAQCPHPVAWVTLDDNDNHPLRFWAYVITALGESNTEFSADQTADLLHDLRAAANEQAPQAALEHVLTTLSNTLLTFSQHTVLVLDDYHSISATLLHQSLAFLVEYLPPTLHLIISSRADPALPLTRLRARNQLEELRQSDLQFSPDESAHFLRQVMKLQLTQGEIEALATRTEGWIAGLQMAALAVRAQSTPGSYAPAQLKGVGDLVQTATASNRYILDYLVEEVLQRQTTAVQTFLLSTAVLKRMCSALCDALLEREPPHSRQLLDDLESANLFVVPLDGERRWYRYHHLFADLLRKRLQQTQPHVVSSLHRRASAWYAAQDSPGEAIEHALAAQDYDHAADLIEGVMEKLLMRSEISTFLSWVEALPPSVTRTRPTMSLFYAWALLLKGRALESVKACIQHITGKHAASKKATLYAFIQTFRGNVERAKTLTQQALADLPEDDLFYRGVATWNLGIAHYTECDLNAAAQALEAAAQMSMECGNLLVAVTALSHRAEGMIIQGRLHQAEATYRRALDLANTAADHPQRPLPIAGMALIGLGELARERNDLDAAAHHLKEGVRLTKGWGDIGTLDGYIALARLRQAQGDPAAAETMIQAAWKVALRFDTTDLDDMLVEQYQVRLWVSQSAHDPARLDAAVAWAQAQEIQESDAASRDAAQRPPHLHAYLRQYKYATLARVYLAQRRAPAAQEISEQLLQALKPDEKGLHIEAQLLRALALQAQGQPDATLDALAEVLPLAQRQGYARIFLDEGPPMAKLLYSALTRGLAPDYINALLAAFPQPTTPRRHPELIEPLSARETEVLTLIAQGLSNQEIAQQLYISLRTVKWHCSNIYGKLCVKNRTQAVAKARTLGILPQS